MLESVRFVYAAVRPWDVTQIRESHGQSVRVDKYAPVLIVSHILSLQCLSSLFLNVFDCSRGDNTIRMIVPIVDDSLRKEFCLCTSLDFPLNNFIEFSRRLDVAALLKNSSELTFSFPVRILKVSIRLLDHREAFSVPMDKAWVLSTFLRTAVFSISVKVL